MTLELLLALQPSPLALTTTSRPGIPAAAELARGLGPEDVEHIEERGEEGEACTGLTWLRYGRRHTRQAQHKESNQDHRDKSYIRVKPSAITQDV